MDGPLLLLDRDEELLLDTDEELLLDDGEEVLLVEDAELPLDKDEEPPLDRDEEPLLDTDEEPLLDADVEPLVDTDEEPLLDTGEEPLVDIDEDPLLGALVATDEGLADALDSGSVAWAQGTTGSPTSPCPALASASFAAACKACAGDIGPALGSGVMKARLALPQAEFRRRQQTLHLRLRFAGPF
jgi:hypothetical protein